MITNDIKILVISWTVYPKSTGSAIIIENLATEFKKSQMVLIGEGISNGFTSNKSKERHSIYYVNPNIGIFGRGQTYLRWLKLSGTLNQVLKIAKEEGCNTILAVFPDDFYIYVAYRISKKLGIPLFTWFHNTYLDNYGGIRKLFAQWLQPKIFRDSRMNFVISDGMLDYFRKQYPEFHFKTLVHGFEIPKIKIGDSTIGANKIKFIYTGNLNASCLDASVRLCNTIMKNPKYELHIFTGNSKSHFEAHGIKGSNVFFHGFLNDSKKFEDSFKDYDVFLLPHGFDGRRTEIEYQTIFPTRTIPALYSNLPILAHSPPEAYLTKFLKEHDCAQIVDEKDELKIEEAIEVLRTDKDRRNTIINNAVKTSVMFDVKLVSQKLKSEMFPVSDEER